MPYQPDRRPGGIRRMRDANTRGADFRFDISKSGPTFARRHEAVLALALIVGTIVSLPPMKLALWTAGCLAHRPSDDPSDARQLALGGP